jgi:hypothetical protein
VILSFYKTNLIPYSLSWGMWYGILIQYHFSMKIIRIGIFLSLVLFVPLILFWGIILLATIFIPIQSIVTLLIMLSQMLWFFNLKVALSRKNVAILYVMLCFIALIGNYYFTFTLLFDPNEQLRLHKYLLLLTIFLLNSTSMIARLPFRTLKNG